MLTLSQYYQLREKIIDYKYTQSSHAINKMIDCLIDADACKDETFDDQDDFKKMQIIFRVIKQNYLHSHCSFECKYGLCGRRIKIKNNRHCTKHIIEINEQGTILSAHFPMSIVIIIKKYAHGNNIIN